MPTAARRRGRTRSAVLPRICQKRTTPARRHTATAKAIAGRCAVRRRRNHLDLPHDEGDRLVSVTDPVGAATGSSTTAGYDLDGNLTRQTDANGHTTTFAWDERHHRTSLTYPATNGYRDGALDVRPRRQRGHEHDPERQAHHVGVRCVLNRQVSESKLMRRYRARSQRRPAPRGAGRQRGGAAL